VGIVANYAEQFANIIFAGQIKRRAAVGAESPCDFVILSP
jgi:hypothetical protein